MDRNLRIDVAFCVELNRVVDIHEACAEFFNQNEHQRFQFLCSDEQCRKSRPGGVRVTAVNHYRIPKERERSAHYRELDSHADNCYWKELELALQEEEEAPAPADEIEKAHRRIARKVTRLVTKFTIPLDEAEEAKGSQFTSEIDRIRKDPDPHQRRRALRQYVRGLGASATSLEALVSCFEELKDLDELEQAFKVEGHGKFKFRQAFRQVKLGPTSRFAVYYGGARLQAKRYGKGFVLKFIDQLQEKAVTLYVSPDNIRGYRPGARMVKMIDEIEALPEPKPYVRVYWIGGLENGDKGWNAAFKTLAHVVLRVVPPKAKAPGGKTEESQPVGS